VRDARRPCRFSCRRLSNAAVLTFSLIWAACGAAETAGSGSGGQGSGGTLGSSGGIIGSGGRAPSGGTTGSGGQTSSGGVPGSGGSSGTGGRGSGGAPTGSGGPGTAGKTGAAGSSGSAGRSGSGGAAGRVGSGGAGGGAASGGAGGAVTVTGPCDLYAAGDTPCVAAHSTVRALYGTYAGNLYQVKRASDRTTKDIAVLAPGGFANAAAQDTFCAGTTCTISIIYDQSPKGNHLTSAPGGGHVTTPDAEAKADGEKLTVGGHSVYAVYIPTGVGYRNDKTSGVATGDQPEGEYMVTSGKHYNNGCCFDYGNAETDNNDDGDATMEAIYFGNCTGWGKGAGSGPWVMADLENGLFAGQTAGTNSGNTPLTSTYVTAMVKGKMGGFALKGGDAQSGVLKTMYEGARPTGYDPMKKQGAILLGIGGDNSNSAVGTFYEGCVTSGYPSTATDDAVQANIVAAGYGR